MRDGCKIGDLVHIPQSVVLIDCDPTTDPQLTIPYKVLETKFPRLGVVVTCSQYGYLRVYCDGANWSVKNESVYKLSGETKW
tara:strand:+ start:2177 stop:2422 length:246 start_codon:yes stop_codon:yes gene_type:complete